SAPTRDEVKPAASAPVKVEPAEPVKDEPKQLREVEMVEHDLSPFGAQFTGYVITAPKDAKLEYDDPSRHIVLSDTDYVDISEAPAWSDSVKSLDKDKDNQNIKKVSDTEYRWERTPPLGKSWLVDTLVVVGKDKWSCGTGMTGTFHSEAMADRIATICKSIKKK
ncbi:MAG TPA: hypothetical protein VK427_14680, partial [Kofleriaceae bacterium]|nr:hypothetical protein [Kofleriaceae bacterium]